MGAALYQNAAFLDNILGQGNVQAIILITTYNTIDLLFKLVLNINQTVIMITFILQL